MEPADWLLTKAERANPRTRLDASHPGEEAWSEGNLVRPLVHGSVYFAELHEGIESARAGTWSTSLTGRATPTRD